MRAFAGKSQVQISHFCLLILDGHRARFEEFPFLGIVFGSEEPGQASLRERLEFRRDAFFILELSQASTNGFMRSVESSARDQASNQYLKVFVENNRHFSMLALGQRHVKPAGFKGRFISSARSKPGECDRNLVSLADSVSKDTIRPMTGIDCIAALKALGEETRLRILRLLFKHQLSVSEISERLSVSNYNISKHLRVMKEAGLLTSEKRGKQRIYFVADALKSEVAANNNVLDLGCCTFKLDKLAKL
jgi:DNA-binding transcriptional ArsR family regulator